MIRIKRCRGKNCHNRNETPCGAGRNENRFQKGDRLHENKEGLNDLKKEVGTMNRKLTELTEDELELVSGANGGLSTQRNINEAVDRMQALRAMTTNVAYTWKQEDRMGSLEVGKLANLTVFSCDFLNDDAEAVANADVVATIIDGKEVYHKRHFQDGVGSIFYGNKQTSSAVGSGKNR